jgi:hypothetical protein
MTHPTLVQTRPLPIQPHPAPPRADHGATRRAWATVSALAALGVVALLTLAPRRIVAPLHGLFLAWTDTHAQPLLAWFPQADTEQVLNAILFLPLGAALALLLRRRLWPLAVIAGVLVSAAAEFAQRSIPGRVPDVGDILWNSVGAAVGAVIVTLVRVVAAVGRRIRERA